MKKDKTPFMINKWVFLLFKAYCVINNLNKYFFTSKSYSYG